MEGSAEPKPGDRVRLVYMPDNYLNLRSGDTGTIRLVDRFGTIHVGWDNGSYSGLVAGVDRWESV
jgi:hypothetical protein